MKLEQPSPTLMSGSDYYKGEAGSRYFDWQNRNGEVTGKIEARKFKTYVKSTDAVLDFGCGGGQVLRNLDCARRVGIEINPAARAVALQGGMECHESIAGIESNCFDVVISNHALEHVGNPISVLSELRNTLKASGVLVLCVPIDDWRVQQKYAHQDINHHLHTWTPQLLGNSLCEAGFTPEQFSIGVLTHAWFPGTPSVYGKLPEPLFDLLCHLFAFVSKRRQLLAVARNRPES